MMTVQIRSWEGGRRGALTWAKGEVPGLDPGTLTMDEASRVRQVMASPFEVLTAVDGQLDGGEPETFSAKDTLGAFRYALDLLVAQAGVVQIRKAPAK